MIQDDLIDAYAYEMRVAECSFMMMGKLLDISYVKQRINILNLEEFYVYGGGYLGIQLYQTVYNHNLAKVLAVIDKKGESSVRIPEIPVINLEKFEDIYREQKVIVASVRYYNEIRNYLSTFVRPDCILFLGEFLGGIL